MTIETSYHGALTTGSSRYYTKSCSAHKSNAFRVLCGGAWYHNLREYSASYTATVMIHATSLKAIVGPL